MINGFIQSGDRWNKGAGTGCNHNLFGLNLLITNRKFLRTGKTSKMFIQSILGVGFDRLFDSAGFLIHKTHGTFHNLRKINRFNLTLNTESRGVADGLGHFSGLNHHFGGNTNSIKTGSP